MSINCCDKSWKEVCGDCNTPPVSDWINNMTHAPEDPVLGHNAVLNGGFTCDNVVEEWQKWIFKIDNLTNPARQRPGNIYQTNPHSANPVQLGVNNIYLTAFPPYFTKQENVQTLVIEDKTNSYILLPILTSEASLQEYPELSIIDNCFDLCVQETQATRRLELCVDGISRIGCYVERNSILEISGVPANNHMNIPSGRRLPGQKIQIVYNGFWALIDVNLLKKGPIEGTGDHLITFEAEGPTYFVAGTLNINIVH